MKSLSIDIETFSSTDLTRSGVFRYSESFDFEIILFGYSIDGGEVKVVDIASGETIPDEIIKALSDDHVVKWAFNSTFERICLSRWLERQGITQGSQFLNPSSWRCTMVWSAYMGLPLSLEGAGIVLGLKKQKLKEGKDLIRYFCQPCNPTKANSGRIRNLPLHAPDKWESFKSYNLRDVETELEIQEKLAKFPVPDFIWEEYHLDQEINDRGVALDMDLVRQAIEADNRSRSELTQLMQSLTELENPNSVSQMKQWLNENGLETDTLGKKAVAEMLKTAPEPLGEVLSLRQQLAKSSVKKYQAMENAVCSDRRAHGMFQFYGANRTGRYSGRLIQMQNLPQNHMPDLEQARSLVKSGNSAALSMLYDSVPVVLSELIRTAFIPKPDHQFIVADFSAIEARVISWLAGESWKMDVFAGEGKIYEATAARMFNVPIESVHKGSPLRQKAKQAELACISEGELVLTDKGLVPIEDVQLHHRLWDGEEWASHEGVVFKGEMEVIEYEGLRATSDHLVWIEGQQGLVPFGIAAANRSHLIQTGNGRKAIRLGDHNRPGKEMEQGHESLLCLNQMSSVRIYTMAESKQSNERKIKGLPKLFSGQANSLLVGQTVNFCEATMRKPKRCWISQLWWPGCSVEFPVNTFGWVVDIGILSQLIARFRNRSHRQQQGLRTRQYSACSAHGQPMQQKDSSIDSLATKVLALFTQCRNQEVVKRIKSLRVDPRSPKGSIQKIEEVANNRGTARVYDIRNAGRHHRFTVSGKLVHNCGYGGSVGALKVMGALEMGLSEDELQPLVNMWRAANPNIVRLWWDVDKAAMTAVRDRTTTETHGILFECRSGMLFILLPSGRRLSYVKPKIGQNQFGKDSVTYEGVGATKKWERIETYGPKLVENIVQAISRDILCHALISLRQYEIVMHVHDEIVIEADKSISLESICEQMSQVPTWAQGLILCAEGYVCSIYKKD